MPKLPKMDARTAARLDEWSRVFGLQENARTQDEWDWLEVEYHRQQQEAEIWAENAWLRAAEAGTPEDWAEEDRERELDAYAHDARMESDAEWAAEEAYIAGCNRDAARWMGTHRLA